MSVKRTKTWRQIGKYFPDDLTGLILEYYPEYKFEDLKHYARKHGASFIDRTTEPVTDLFENKWSLRTESGVINTKIACPVSLASVMDSLGNRTSDKKFDCLKCKKKLLRSKTAESKDEMYTDDFGIRGYDEEDRFDCDIETVYCSKCVSDPDNYEYIYDNIYLPECYTKAEPLFCRLNYKDFGEMGIPASHFLGYGNWIFPIILKHESSHSSIAETLYYIGNFILDYRTQFGVDLTAAEAYIYAFVEGSLKYL